MYASGRTYARLTGFFTQKSVLYGPPELLKKRRMTCESRGFGVCGIGI